MTLRARPRTFPRRSPAPAHGSRWNSIAVHAGRKTEAGVELLRPGFLVGNDLQLPPVGRRLDRRARDGRAALRSVVLRVDVDLGDLGRAISLELGAKATGAMP